MGERAKGVTLDALGKVYNVTRLRFRTITLLFGWKLAKAEKDKDYRRRVCESVIESPNFKELVK